ncbi:hypothetical protein HELRODRAFT_165489 [Helobdella robusta]|uniref:Uncharacterized protein n=1 Tax=Helobdella robusta TaxID=6412 RepID=T1EWW5_HELRO|nr:hypothetical protein HELRODRAFT_165489 [Helobdella robusta]ESN91453.1 hypothetical protein HELRODRAFT_165489 [Helobdella robusta]
MWLVAKNSFLLSPDLTLIILHIALKNLRVLGFIGPRTSIHIGKNSIEGRAFSYFFIFSSAALVAAKPHSLLVRFTYRSARVPGTVTSHAKHLPALQDDVVNDDDLNGNADDKDDNQKDDDMTSVTVLADAGGDDEDDDESNNNNADDNTESKLKLEVGIFEGLDSELESDIFYPTLTLWL